MERSWWWKASAFALAIVVSVVVLLPTFVGEEKLPGWFNDVVDDKLQLGLDLQGGIHLVYEVEVDKAISDKADRLATDIEDRLREDKKLKVTVIREGRDDVQIQVQPPQDLSKVDDEFLRDYRSDLTEIERDDTTGVVLLRMDEENASAVSDSAIRQAQQTIRGRVDQFGVAEPNVMLKGRDIVIELPGLTERDFERVKRQIGRTAQLEFKMVDDESELMAKIARVVPKDGLIEVRHDNYDGLQHGSVNVTYLQSKDKNALQSFLADVPEKGVPIPATHQILLGEDFAKDEKGNDLPDKIWMTYLLKKRTELTGEYLTDASVDWDPQTGKPEVALTFDRKGADLFEKLSGDNVGRRMAIVLDNKVNSAPVFQTRIGGGRARITLGGFKDPMQLQQEAQDLASVLKVGALPAPLRKTFERQVGPTLGQDAIRQGVMAFVIGAILVLILMVSYYRVSGVIADMAVIVNVLFILAILASMGGALTLPGIAGLVITIGMAVDANVIINERVREEMALGKTPRAAVDSGYSNAFSTIFDAQVTTLIAGVVLWQYGSGPIQGFARTLIAGIICSIVTGVFFTRVLIDFVVVKFRPTKLSI